MRRARRRRRIGMHPDGAGDGRRLRVGGRAYDAAAHGLHASELSAASPPFPCEVFHVDPVQ